MPWTHSKSISVANRTFGDVVNPTPIERSESQILSTWEFWNRPTRLYSVTVRSEMMDRFKTRPNSVHDNKRHHQFYVIRSWYRFVLHLESRIAGILKTLRVSLKRAQTEFQKSPTYRVYNCMYLPQIFSDLSLDLIRRFGRTWNFIKAKDRSEQISPLRAFELLDLEPAVLNTLLMESQAKLYCVE